MPLSFPSSPSVNQTSTQNGRVYRWSGLAWEFDSFTSAADDARWSLFLPPAPTGVTATAGNGQATVTWTAPSVLSVTPVTDYVVQFSSNSGTTWTTFSDGTSTSTSAVVTGLTNGTAYTFRVAGVNGVGTGAYSAASSAVTPTAPTPVITITTQPTNQTASSGAATFSVAATVTQGATLSYQWQKQEGGAGSFSNVSGATSSLALTGMTNADDNGDVYRCVVSATGGAQSVTSSSATLTVAATPVITITTQPANQAASYGTATFSVAATVTEGATLSYQWQKQENGAGSFSNVSGGTGPILVLTQLTSADDNGDVYRCVVSATGGAQSVTSSSAGLTVTLNNYPLPGGGQTLNGFELSGAPIEWGSYPPAYSGYASLNGSYVDEYTYWGGNGPQPGNMWVSAGDGNWAIWYSSNHGVCTCYDASGNVVGTRQLSGWGLIWVPTWTLRAYAPGSLAGIPPSTNWYHIYDDGYGGGATCSRDVEGNGTVVGFQDCDPSVLPPTSPYHPGYAASLTFTPA